MPKTKNLAIIIILLLSISLPVLSQTTPEKFLGHRVGEDRKLADYNQIKGYFELLAKESPKIKVVNIGKTTLGKDMIMAIITDEENMKNLDRYRDIARRLKEARGLSQDQARQLAREGKTILLITCSVHATEIAASQMSLELAYDLITGKDFSMSAGRSKTSSCCLFRPSIPTGFRWWPTGTASTLVPGMREAICPGSTIITPVTITTGEFLHVKPGRNPSGDESSLS